MKDVPQLFADLTVGLEDLHSVAVEGQRSGLTPDIQEALLASVRVSLRRIHRIVLNIGLTLP
jgi:hypothetical protein